MPVRSIGTESFNKRAREGGGGKLTALESEDIERGAILRRLIFAALSAEMKQITVAGDLRARTVTASSGLMRQRQNI